MRFSIGFGAMIAVILIAPAAITTTAYGVTMLGAGSICLSEGGWSDAPDKLRGARRYIEQHPLPDDHRQSTALAGLDQPSCCSIDKGGRDIPHLSFSAYILHGKTHYVHVPILGTIREQGREIPSLITVDGCGNGLSAGVDL